MKKVCFFSGDITRSGGTERVSIQIANSLKQDGIYDICFISLTEQAEEPFYPLDPRIKRYSLSKKWINPGPGYLPIIGKLRRFLKTNGIDIIIDIDIVLDVLSIPAARGLKAKVVSWEHFTADFEQSVPYRKMILKYSVKHSDYAVVLTDLDLAEYNKLGRNKAISRIYNPVAYNFEMTLQNRENIILSVGRLVAEKGTDYIKEVALKVLKKRPDWKWIILGDGEKRAEIETFIEQNKLQNQLILMGCVDNVCEYLSKAKIFVLTSLYEGLGLSMLEAMEMKVPCVAFDVKMGPKELISNGFDGYLVKPFDCDEMAGKIEYLMDFPDKSKEIAENAYLRMSEFKNEKITKQWKTLLDEIL